MVVWLVQREIRMEKSKMTTKEGASVKRKFGKMQC